MLRTYVKIAHVHSNNIEPIRNDVRVSDIKPLPLGGTSFVFTMDADDTPGGNEAVVCEVETLMRAMLNFRSA